MSLVLDEPYYTLALFVKEVNLFDDDEVGGLGQPLKQEEEEEEENRKKGNSIYYDGLVKRDI